LDKSDSNDAIRNKYSFITQWISDLSQLSLAVAIGLFGILAISVGIDQVTGQHHTGLLELKLMGNLWELLSKIILLAAYFALVLVGAICILQHKLYSLLQEKYISKYHGDLINDMKEVVKLNCLLRIATYPWLDNMGKLKESMTFMIITVLVPFLVISILLAVFVIII
jgi:hypothetical protein